MNESDVRPGEHKPPASLLAHRTAHVLVVEDDSDLRGAVREALELYGFTVEALPDGASALGRAATSQYDVVVSDIRLPGASGFDVARAFRMGKRPPRIILMTADPAWSVYQEAEEVGALYVISKPFSLKSLARAIEEAAQEVQESPVGT